MVASQEGRATRIGVDVLKAGGNAVDAAVAVGFALAVTLPRAGNIGGGGFMLVHLAARNETIAIDFVYTAVSLMSETVDLLFASYSVDTTQVLDRFHHAFFAALTS